MIVFQQIKRKTRAHRQVIVQGSIFNDLVTRLPTSFHHLKTSLNHLRIEGPLDPEGILQAAGGLWEHHEGGGVDVPRTRHVGVLHVDEKNK